MDTSRQLIEDYFSLLRFPSISSDPAHAKDLRDCCNFVANYLQSSGLRVDVVETPGAPVVLAEWDGAGSDKPTVLLYCHYDVQPVDPLDEWVSLPFEPRLDGKTVFARGAQDNKGQLMYTMAALRSLMQEEGSLPVNVKFCIEGEEESKSCGLTAILREIAPRLKADYFVSPDSGIPSMETPVVTLGHRGIVALTIQLRGSNSDLHSGLFGGVVYNPNHALVELLAKLRASDGRILVPGFYEDVKEMPETERRKIWLDVDFEALCRDIDATATGGERSYAPGESACIRPTLEINGISGGYAGPGFKTVIPAVAQAKVSCRLVPDQDPEKVANAIIGFLHSHLPPGIEIKIENHGGAKAVRGTPDSPVSQALVRAYEDVMQRPCRFLFSGGSIPISAALSEAAGAMPTFCGLGLPTDKIHAPNEHFDLDRLETGFKLVRRFLQILGEGGSKK